MKTEINIMNGRGWNNYTALRTLKTLKPGCRGLAAKQGVRSIDVAPRNSDRPLGIAVRYYDDDGELIFTQGFDQNDGADYIRDRIYALLSEGIQNRINANKSRIRIEAYKSKISAWRRNFDAKSPVSDSLEKLLVKFHAMRRAALPDFQPSHKLCTYLAMSVAGGDATYKDAVSQLVAAGGRTPTK